MPLTVKHVYKDGDATDITVWATCQDGCEHSYAVQPDNTVLFNDTETGETRSTLRKFDGVWYELLEADLAPDVDQVLAAAEAYRQS